MQSKAHRKTCPSYAPTVRGYKSALHYHTGQRAQHHWRLFCKHIGSVLSTVQKSRQNIRNFFGGLGGKWCLLFHLLCHC